MKWSLAIYEIGIAMLKSKFMSISLTLLFFILLNLSAPVSAGDGSGKIEIEHVGGFGVGTLVFFYTTVHTLVPTCNTFKQRWVLNLDSVAGKEQYSLLLAAQMAGMDVKVQGNGQCNIWGDSETVSWVGLPTTR